MRTAVCALLLMQPAANRAVAQRRTEGTLQMDTSLFTAVVRYMHSAPGGYSLRVDPRPLRPDPSLVELAPSVSVAAPDLVTTPLDPLEPIPARVVARRSRAIARLRLGEADVFRHPRCPSLLVSGPPELNPNREPLPECPAISHRVAILAIPRPGGAHLPGVRSAQQPEHQAGVWSVRVIQRDLTPFGASASASDYVVARGANGRWRVIQVVPLVVIE